MSKPPAAIEVLPASAVAALVRLGHDLGIARKRRGQSLKDWAARMEVSIPTLMRMERGEPRVSMGVYATAAWLIGRHEALATVADPKEDVPALESDILQAQRRHRARGVGNG